MFNAASIHASCVAGQFVRSIILKNQHAKPLCQLPNAILFNYSPMANCTHIGYNRCVNAAFQSALTITLTNKHMLVTSSFNTRISWNSLCDNRSFTMSRARSSDSKIKHDSSQGKKHFRRVVAGDDSVYPLLRCTSTP
jgi:hypothetical protein